MNVKICLQSRARRRDGEALPQGISTTLTREQREIIVLRDLNGFQYTEDRGQS